MLTQSQINNFRSRARERGFSEDQIQREIARKQQELINFENTNKGNNLRENPVDANVIGSFLKELAKPAVGYVKHVAEGLGQGGRYVLNKKEYDTISNKITANTATPNEIKRFEELNAPIVMKNEELQKYSTPGGVIKETFKKTAGGASYFVPGGGSAATRILSGAASAALGEISEDDATIDSVISASIAGLGTGAAFEGLATVLSKGGKYTTLYGEKLAKKGQNIKIQEYVKKVGGKPINREGGNALLLNMKKVGIDPGDVDSIVAQSDDLIDNLSPIIGQQMDDLTEKGIVVSVDDLTQPLKRQLKKKMMATDKQRLKSVIADIESYAGNKKTLTPSELYDLKQRMGQLGKWNSNANVDELAKGELWKDLYIKANSMTDDLLRNNGFDDFREINEIIHTAINAKSYAQRIGNRAPNLNTVGLLDLTAATIGGAAGGIPGAVATYTTRKILNSPQMTNAIGSAVEGAGKKLIEQGGKNSTSNVVNTLINNEGSQALRNVAAQGSKALLTTGEEDINNPENDSNSDTDNNAMKHNAPIITPEIDNNQYAEDTNENTVDPFMGLSKKQVLLLAISKGFNKSQLEEIAAIYDMVSPSKTTYPEDIQKSASSLRSEYLTQTKNNGYIEILNNYNKLKKVPDTAAGDLSLIYAYMKMLDPGSVVRETEQSIAQNATNLPGKFQNYVQRVVNGKGLNKKQRQEFIEAAESIYLSTKETQEEIDSLYSGLAQDYGVDPKLIGIGRIGNRSNK